jgi:hypothetical protein
MRGLNSCIRYVIVVLSRIALLTVEYTSQDFRLNKLRHVEQVSYDTGPVNLRGPCTPQTREHILDSVMAWATDDTSQPVYWLGGMAGTGKTTIAYSLCERLEKTGLLCSSFFCSRTIDATREPRVIIPTISYQIARRLKPFSTALLDALNTPDNDEIHNKIVRTQFTVLVLQPGKDLAASQGFKRKLIVCDGFDEARERNKEAGGSEVGEIISHFLKYGSALPFKIFISSRLDEHITSTFKFNGSGQHESLLLHNVEHDIVEADIRRYIVDRVDAITERRWRTRSEWISDNQIDELVSRSGKLFVYASAVCAFLGQGTATEVKRRMDILFEHLPEIPGIENTPYDRLNLLYKQILDEALGDDTRSILRVLISSRSQLSIEILSSLLGFEPFRTEKAVLQLHAVLTIPMDYTHSTPITIFHASFRDFLVTPKRSRDHFIDIGNSNHLLALSCLRVMEDKLKQDNICKLDSKDTPKASIPPSVIQNSIPLDLQYACINWLSHITELDMERARSLEHDIIAFFDHRVLRWIECMSFLGRLQDVMTSLREAELLEVVRRR